MYVCCAEYRSGSSSASHPPPSTTFPPSPSAMSRSIQHAPSSSEDEEETEGSVERRRWNLLYRDFSRLHKRCGRRKCGRNQGLRKFPQSYNILLYRYQKLSGGLLLKLGRNGLVGEAIDSLHCMHLFDLLLLDSALLNKLQPADGLRSTDRALVFLWDTGCAGFL